MTIEMEKRLYDCNTLTELLTMYFGLSMKEKLSIFDEEITIPKGAKFYRVRKVDGFNTPNYIDPKEWGPVPELFSKQGRFNKQGESVLYVASTPDFLEREVRIKEGEEYYLASYRCKKDFQVGTFFGYNNLINAILFRITMSVAGPEDLNEIENQLIEKYFDKVKDKPLSRQMITCLSPLYMHKIIPNLYDITNKLGKIMGRKYDCGFRYSSVYFPIEISGGSQLLTIDGIEYGNYVLTPKGCENIELVDVERKTCEQVLSLETLIEGLAKE